VTLVSYTTMTDTPDRRGVISPFNTIGMSPSALMTNPPRIADCTLRDGEQMAGLVFNKEDKVAIARLLDNLGVHDLEVGTPAVSDEDRLAVEEIVASRPRAMISALARSDKRDVDLVARCGAQAVRISQPISNLQRDAKFKLDDEAYLKQAIDISTYSKEKGLQVIFSPYDTTRADVDLLKRLLVEFRRLGCVDRVRLVDTAGAATPHAIRYLVGVMTDAGGGIPIEVHCHNDFGLAVANTLAGAEAGAAYLSVTVNGVGERAGNASLEEVVMALQTLYRLDLGLRLDLLYQLSREVAARSKVPVQPHKAVVGSNAFAHETGMVVAGVLKDPSTAEPYPPELVGQTRSILIGKKSGRASIEYKLHELGIEVSADRIPELLARVKDRSIESKSPISDEQFADLARDLVPAGGRSS
jgi:isopropylmalate/homocitrate/citramalate synthase